MRKLTSINNRFKMLAFKCKTIVQLDRVVKIYNLYVQNRNFPASKFILICFELERRRILPCEHVPWRGRGGNIGQCIKCGE